MLRGAGRVFAIDNVASRLEIARSQGAEAINFNEDDPVQALHELTRGIGPDRVIDAVGVDAEGRQDEPNVSLVDDEIARIERQRSQVYSDPPIQPESWIAGSAPMQALVWAVDALAKSGTLGIVGVYPLQFESFPLGKAFERNLTVKMGICHHRRYIPKLVQMVSAGEVDPTVIMPHQETLLSAIEAYESLDHRDSRWMQVELVRAL
jgi:threonine dehydrogenase-like Zn-dependent dehydrogenase